MLFGGVVFAQVVIDPGRGLIEIPIAGRDDLFAQLLLFPIFLQSGVGADVDAFFLSGINLAPALEASAAGAVALVFRALGHRAEIGDVDEGAVSAVPAVEEDHFFHMFDFMKRAFQRRPAHLAAQSLHEAIELFPRFEHQPMEEPRKPVGAFDIGVGRPR